MANKYQSKIVIGLANFSKGRMKNRVSQIVERSFYYQDLRLVSFAILLYAENVENMV
jgi:glutamate formiminotransferase